MEKSGAERHTLSQTGFSVAATPGGRYKHGQRTRVSHTGSQQAGGCKGAGSARLAGTGQERPFHSAGTSLWSERAQQWRDWREAPARVPPPLSLCAIASPSPQERQEGRWEALAVPPGRSPGLICSSASGPCGCPQALANSASPTWDPPPTASARGACPRSSPALRSRPDAVSDGRVLPPHLPLETLEVLPGRQA